MRRGYCCGSLMLVNASRCLDLVKSSRQRPWQCWKIIWAERAHVRKNVRGQVKGHPAGAIMMRGRYAWPKKHYFKPLTIQTDAPPAFLQFSARFPQNSTGN